LGDYDHSDGSTVSWLLCARAMVLGAVSEMEVFSAARLASQERIDRDVLDAHRHFQTDAPAARQRLEAADDDLLHELSLVLQRRDLYIPEIVHLLSGRIAAKDIQGSGARRGMARRLGQLGRRTS
jgi:hypothetical protein